MTTKVLKCYPFARLINPPVKLVEGFKAYDGYLGDERGREHKGIDYVVEPEKGKFISFDVFSAHDGRVFQGISEKGYGRFVIIYIDFEDFVFATIYAHFRTVHPQIPFLPKKKRGKGTGLMIFAGRFLGKAGITGWTKRRIQLHFELLRKEENKENAEWGKIDPYGINDVVSSGKYPQPGHSLRGLEHFWITDRPLFANEVKM